MTIHMQAKAFRVGLVVALVAGPAAGRAGADELEYPVDVARDAKGGIYVADHQAHALLKLEGGSFRVVARGKGLPRTPLFGIRHIAPDRDGSLVASDPATMKLYRIDGSGGIDPIADDDRLVTPWGVAVEPSGAILVVDRVTHRLRRIEAGGKVEDVAEVQAPRAILFDKERRILVLTDRNLVRIENGEPRPLLEDPPFEFPHDAVLHPNGNVYVTDGYARAVWQVGPDGKVAALLQGEPLVSPQGVAVDAKGNLLVADAHARSVFQISPEGNVTALGK